MKIDLIYVFRKMILFNLVGGLYVIIEYLYRGFSHYSMYLLAGVLGIFIDSLNNKYTYEMDYLLQIIISTIVCVAGEGITGVIVNIWLGLDVWDYSALPYNFFFGQCNLFFVGAWILIIGLIAIPFCDAFWYYICDDDEQPYYKICGKEFFRFSKKK